MRTQFIGRLLLSLVLIASTAGLTGFQWNETHVFNPTGIRMRGSMRSSSCGSAPVFRPLRSGYSGGALVNLQ
jgi:hypothetical protein